MKATVEVTSVAEADLIKAGLNNPVMRAMVQMLGALNALPDDASRTAAMHFVQAQLKADEKPGDVLPIQVG